jgi:hypothetical protein
VKLLKIRVLNKETAMSDGAACHLTQGKSGHLNIFIFARRFEGMTYLDFEKPIQDLEEEIEKLKDVASKSKVDLSDKITELEGHIKQTTKELYSNLSPWQRVQVSRHPDRPYTLAYIDYVSNKTFIELHGDRT